MKDQILKIAKVKSEKEFYKKYPTEEAFMKVHGKALEKAAMGKSMVNKQLKQLTDFGNPPIAQDGAFKPLSFNDMLSGVQATNLGMTKGDYLEGRKSGQIADPMAAPKQSNGIGNFISMASDVAGEFMGGEGASEGDKAASIEDMPIHRYGGDIPHALGGGLFNKIGAGLKNFTKSQCCATYF